MNANTPPHPPTPHPKYTSCVTLMNMNVNTLPHPLPQDTSCVTLLNMNVNTPPHPPHPPSQYTSCVTLLNMNINTPPHLPHPPLLYTSTKNTHTVWANPPVYPTCCNLLQEDTRLVSDNLHPLCSNVFQTLRQTQRYENKRHLLLFSTAMAFNSCNWDYNSYNYVRLFIIIIPVITC